MSTKRKSKAKKWIIISLIAIVLLFLAAGYLTRQGRTPYESVNAKTADITTYYSFSGNVDTKNRQTVMPDKAMQISEIEVKEGDMVKEGDVLLKSSAGDEIKAEVNGEVINLNVEENQQAMPGTKLMEIVDYDNLEVSVKVDEYDVSALKEGQEATVNIAALNKEVKGTISSMSDVGQIVNGVTYFPATVDLPKDSGIKIGMSAEAKVLSAKAAGAVTLPMYAIQFDDNNKPFVYIKDINKKKNLVKRVDITTGINDGTVVEVKSGITSGETIYYEKASTAAVSPFRMGRSSTNRNNSNTNNNNNGGNSND